MIGLKIPKNQAEYVRRILLKYSMIDLKLKIKRQDNYVLIPLIKEPPEEIIAEMGISQLEVVHTSFEDHQRSPRSLKGYLEGQIVPEKIEEINKSFDIIGDIVILEIPEEFESIKYLIADAALKFTKRRSIYRKGSKVKGIKRTRYLEFLAGEDISQTIHKEYGSRFMLDVRKVYFSPRLATERDKIVKQVKDDEIIIDMFAGVGPFSISIARQHEGKIYAIDINPDAIYYLKRNIELNKVKGEIIPISGDVKKFLENNDIKADRIIMNLPGMACKFLKNAIKSLKEGGILHYYEFSSDFNQPVTRIREAAGSRKVTILDKRRVKSSSPGRWHMGIDAKIH
ncbi:MAG: class I SAM-dependent methyltransferase family protein [Methanobacterium sp.]|nr:class I SAM-dependent methyltransferase family protein [Methanobacterium sp.]